MTMLNRITCLRTARPTIDSHSSAPTIKVTTVAHTDTSAVPARRSKPKASASRQISAVTKPNTPAATAPVSARDNRNDNRHGWLAATIPLINVRLPVSTRAV